MSDKDTVLEKYAPSRDRGLTRAQIERLLGGIDPGIAETKQGLTYIPQHDVRAELTRIFGFGGWSSEVEHMERLWEMTLVKGDPGFPKGAKDDTIPYYRVCYRARVRLTIFDHWGNVVTTFVEEHAEANSALPDRGEAEAMAVTSVESYALRRCAINLGDRLGLSLYNRGSLVPLIKGTLQTRRDPEAPLFTPEPEREGGE